MLKKITAVGKAGIKAFSIYKRSWKSPEDIKKIQDRAINKAVSIAYNHTGFYREKYKSYGVHPDDIRSVDDLPKLPVITKQELIDNFESSIPKPINRDMAFFMGTSGTTGQALHIYKDYKWLAYGFTFAIRMFKLHKLGLFPKTAFIYDAASKTGIEKNMDQYFKYFTCAPLLIPVDQDIKKIMRQLEGSGINYLATYTGVMRELATLKKNGIGQDLNLIKVGLSGELLDDYTRHHIEEAFNCECFSAYITTEGGPIAFECPNKKMHINSDFVVPEIVDEKGNPLPPGMDGLILLTCCDGSYSTPIIRYSGCADISQIITDKCTCGINTPILGTIKGRAVDSIKLPDGKVFHAFSMTVPMEKIQRDYCNGRMRRYQIIQHALDQITISIVRNAEKTSPDDNLNDLKKMIKDIYQEKLGSAVKINVREIKFDELKKTGSEGMPTPLVLSELSKNNKVTTESIGEEENRKVVIKPASTSL